MTAFSRTEYTYDTLYRLAQTFTEVDGNAAKKLTATYTYENDYLTAIQTASTTYGFEYGDFGLRESISVGDNLLARYTYYYDGVEERDNYLKEIFYGNNLDGFLAGTNPEEGNDWVRYTYDDYGRVISETWGNDDTVAYKYDNSGGLASIFDSATGRTTSYYYDLTDRLMKYAVTGSSYKHSVGYKYDISNNLLSLVEDINDTALTTSYTYDQDNRVTSVTTVIKTVEGTNTFTTTVTETYTYDEYGRVSVKQTKKGTGEDASVVLTETYSYKTVNGNPTNQLASVSVALANKTIAYSLSYDDNGNIISYDDGTHEITYVYDSANQLIRENNPRRSKTYTWTYDNAGNVLTYAEYAYTTESLGTAPTTKSYDYGEKGQSGGWGDLLTTYDGKDFTYDTIGNLISDTEWTYNWEKGRQLASMTGNGTTWNFTYDADGMRTGRSNSTTAYTYTYNGGQLSQMTVNGKNVTFSYDASGNPQTMTYDGVTYYYITNPMGDVTGIANESGIQLVYYYYTAYGTAYVSYNTAYQTLGATLSGVNPLFYRGYVYDREIGLYYLQSRYYNPKVGRFINADALVATGQGLIGNNMFAYCGNNPVMRVDFSGTAYKRATTLISISGSGSKNQVHQPPDYIQVDDETINCYAYAFGLDESSDPGQLSGHGPMYQGGKQFYTPDEIAALIQSDIEAGHINARRIYNLDELQDDEYLVVMKTSDTLVKNQNKSDYHFAILLSNGTWADKEGHSPSRWNGLNGFAKVWDKFGQPGYYNSDPVYYAVKRRP